MFFFLLSFSCSTDSGKGKADNTAEHIRRSLPAHQLYHYNHSASNNL
ncbi:hypothetical protein BACOVA_00486 [Bacteroides ovatus ATCC 8483]|uniref:Uncharacterized protein n=1 Tax=Bacteroides ovatus (strain ATCC 8483 / DSM 1896 / JCM 5824 / BCRC 10623 / CCUG 4943 / NCTC 11153) TaxID=411476 RepID=A0AAN3ACF0_BACO1|nr:hypothetical protein BACOVA_00486 [Bacteroides ovatus ATCC 8483]